MIRNLTDDWIILLRNGPLTIHEMISLTHCGKETVYRAMLRHEKQKNTCRLMGAWTLTEQGKERVESLLSAK